MLFQVVTLFCVITLTPVCDVRCVIRQFHVLLALHLVTLTQLIRLRLPLLC